MLNSLKGLVFGLLSLIILSCNPQQPPYTNKKKQDQKIAKISSLTDPQSLDPRFPATFLQ